MRAGSERRGLVQEAPRPGDHALAALGIVAFARRRLAVPRNSVRAIKRVVERAPSRIGGIERIARVTDRHHQLRSGDGGDFVVDIGGVDFEGRPFGNEITDLLKEGLVRGLVERAAAPAPIPIVYFCLQGVPALQQRAVQRGEAVNDAIKPQPKRRGLDPGAGKDLVDDEVVKDPGNLQAVNGHALGLGHLRVSISFVGAANGARGAYNSGLAFT